MIRGGLIALCFLYFVGCNGCGDKPLATLLRHQSRVERDLNESVGEWKAVEGKDSFLDGDGLRTFEDAEAMLELAGGGKVRVEADTTIRFRRNASGSAAATSVDVESGLAEVEAGDAAVGIKTRFGLAVLSKGGKLRVDRMHGAERYRVEIGEAVFPEQSGGQKALQAGDQLDIELGLAELEPVTPVAPEEPEPEPVAETALADAGTGAADDENLERETDHSGATDAPPRDTLATTDHADFELTVGENVTINDPAPPTAIGFAVGSVCPNGGALEVQRRRAHGTQINVPLKAGNHSYRVYCFESPGKLQRRAQSTGVVRVRRSTGTARLPTTAPRNRIDVDGRRYTVMFQNLLPEIEVRWPNAPSAASYTLERTVAGETTTERSTKPSVRFAAGQVAEGEHRLRFKADGGQTSDETTLTVRFDNAAPSVSLRSPAASGFEPGAEVRVSGVATADTRVSVLGNPVALDRHHRFDTTVAVPSGSRSFTVRIDHPRTGTQYYVRRERGTR